MGQAATFRALHFDRAAGDPLVLPGPWDAASAAAFADAGFPALATPSAGIAASLGYADGQTPPSEMFAAVARIARAVSIPVSADIEGGYGLPPRELVARLLEAGAVGCNLEDSAHGELEDPRRHAELLAEVRAEAGDALFLNARVDTFIHGDRNPADAVDRAGHYVAAGADCIYPIGAAREVLPQLRAGITGPLNMVHPPVRGQFAELGRLGATRITFGPLLHRRVDSATRELARELRSDG